MSPHPNFTLAEPFTARVSSGIDSGGGSMGVGLGWAGSIGGWEHRRVGAWEGEHWRVGAWEHGGWVHECGSMGA